jgi:hypothetical protein
MEAIWNCQKGAHNCFFSVYSEGSVLIACGAISRGLKRRKNGPRRVWTFRGLRATTPLYLV